MTTNMQLSTDDQIGAALEELVKDTQRLYDARDTGDAEECAFWKRQRNAFIRAQGQWLKGVRPTPTPSGYLIPSASRPGAVEHRCYQIGGVWTCTCEAGERGEFHWHPALINAVELAAERAGLRERLAAIGDTPDTDVSPIFCPGDDPCSPENPCPMHAALAAGDWELPFFPLPEEIEREQRLAAIYAEADDWYMAA